MTHCELTLVEDRCNAATSHPEQTRGRDLQGLQSDVFLVLSIGTGAAASATTHDT